MPEESRTKPKKLSFRATEEEQYRWNVFVTQQRTTIDEVLRCGSVVAWLAVERGMLDDLNANAEKALDLLRSYRNNKHFAEIADNRIAVDKLTETAGAKGKKKA